MSAYSLIIPAYNESHRLPAFLATFPPLLWNRSDLELEIIIVEDGSTPANVQKVAECISRVRAQLPNVSFRHEVQPENAGKGAAIQHGLSVAKYDLAGFLDADGSTSIKSWLELAYDLAQHPELACVMGSRIKMLGRNVSRSGLRHYVGRVFATYVSLLFRLPVYDSQCGAKIYRYSRIREVLGDVTDMRFVWDTQLLASIYRRGLLVREHPVDWNEVGENRLSLVSEPLRMAWALFKYRLMLARKERVQLGLQKPAFLPLNQES